MTGQAHDDFTPRTEGAKRAYEHQTQIGWNHFMKGRLAKAWGQEIAEVYAKSTTIGYSEFRRRFLSLLFTQSWVSCNKLWIKRSSKLHDETDIHALSTEELNRRIRFFFTQRTILFERGDHDRFNMGLDHTLQLSKYRKQEWLQTLERRKLATTKARASLSRQMRPIPYYF